MVGSFQCNLEAWVVMNCSVYSTSRTRGISYQESLEELVLPLGSDDSKGYRKRRNSVRLCIRSWFCRVSGWKGVLGREKPQPPASRVGTGSRGLSGLVEAKASAYRVQCLLARHA